MMVIALCLFLGLGYAILAGALLIWHRGFEKIIERYANTGRIERRRLPGMVHKALSRGGQDIHYYTAGQRRGPCVVFLHPAFGDHRCFNDQMAYFASHYRIIVIDMLGHGRSSAAVGGMKIDASAEHIAAILHQEKIPSAHLVGVSMGALIAQYTALKYPKIVRSLTAAGGYDINADNRAIRDAQKNQLFKWLVLMIVPLKVMKGYNARITAVEELSQVRFFNYQEGFSRLSLAAMGGLDKVVQKREGVRREYPLLLIGGEDDRPLAISAMRQWHDREQDASEAVEMHIVKGAGHLVNMDRPDTFNPLLADFLKTVKK